MGAKNKQDNKMQVQIQIIKVYLLETDGGDTLDPDSVQAHIEMVENMQSTEIEAEGKLVDVFTEYAEVVGPSDI
jgi:hypothetical protein